MCVTRCSWDGHTVTPTPLTQPDSPFALAISRMRLAIAVLSDLKLALPTPVRLSTPDFDRSVHLGTSVLTESYRTAAQYLPVPILVRPNSKASSGFVDATLTSAAVYSMPSPRLRGTSAWVLGCVPVVAAARARVMC